MNYPLQDLLRVRQHREERAGANLARAARHLDEARAALASAQDDLSEYTVWRIRQEHTMLDGLMRRVLRPGELSDTRLEISLLREREFEFHDRVRRAEAQVEKAEAALEDARREHAKTVRELEKLLEHRATWQEEQRLHLERAEEAELEEFAGPARSLIAIGGHHE